MGHQSDINLRRAAWREGAQIAVDKAVFSRLEEGGGGLPLFTQLPTKLILGKLGIREHRSGAGFLH